MLNQKVNSILPLTDEEADYLEVLSSSRSASVSRARAAAMLLQYVDGVPKSDIARTYRISVPTVERRIDKALNQEIISARGKHKKKRDSRAITTEMVEWARGLSCRNPRSFGYSCVEWPAPLLAQHVRDHCRAAGHHALAGLSYIEIEALLDQTAAHPASTSTTAFFLPEPDAKITAPNSEEMCAS